MKYHNGMRIRSTNTNLILLIFEFLRKLFGGSRFDNLFKYIEYETSLMKKKIGKKITLLDYGCGKLDFTFLLKKKNFINKAVCVDNYQLKHTGLPKNIKYLDISKSKINFKKNFFDLAIVIDVLHHIGVNNCQKQLQEICHVSKYVIIKDHFEYSYLSRQLLRLADWYGNYGTEVNIPKKYFTKNEWYGLIKKCKLKQIKIIQNVKQHKGLFSLILSPKHQFISVIQKN